MSLNFAAATKILEWGKPVGWVAEQCKTITRNEMAIKYPTVKEGHSRAYPSLYRIQYERCRDKLYDTLKNNLFKYKNTPQNSG